MAEKPLIGQPERSQRGGAMWQMWEKTLTITPSFHAFFKNVCVYVCMTVFCVFPKSIRSLGVDVTGYCKHQLRDPLKLESRLL